MFFYCPQQVILVHVQNMDKPEIEKSKLIIVHCLEILLNNNNNKKHELF